VNIIQAIRDEHIFQPFLGELETWRQWMTAMRCLYGLPVQSATAKDLIEQCTGRTWESMPEDGFDTALFLTGRRSGKSRTAAIIGAYEAVLSGRHERLAKGEQGLVAVISPTKKQSSIVAGYLRSVFDTPILRKEVVSETAHGFLLRNGVQVAILSGDWRTVRGFTLLAAVVDEVCFLGLDAETKVRNDTELIQAIQPALATCRGRLVAISSPYAKKGWAYKRYQTNFGNHRGRTLVWNAPSRVMNPTLSQSIVDAAMAEDRASALAEYMGQWRDDVGAFISREMIEKLIVTGRTELMPKVGNKYQAFVDVSGGRSDSSALAIAHRNHSGKIVLDVAKHWKSPHDPQWVVEQMSHVLRDFEVKQVVGDNYSGEWCAQAFQNRRIKYSKCDLPKSQLYLEALPVLCSEGVVLLDIEQLTNEWCGLERRTRSGGKDSVDHGPGQHDDLANAVAGVMYLTSLKKSRVGGLTPSF
jgi:hypothetical protein